MYTLKIEHDECAIDMWDDETELIFLSNHRHYNSRNNDGIEFENFEAMSELRDHYKDHSIFPIYAYIHSGIALSTGREYPFDDQWDSGLFGFLIIPPNTLTPTLENVKRYVESWSMNWNGENYGYVIEDSNNEIIKSCYGFIGEESAREEGEIMLEVLRK